MKIAFFSSRVFGLRGTPGTYKFLHYLNNRYDVLLFAPLKGTDIVFEDNKIPIVHFNEFYCERSVLDLLSVISAYNPDIIYIFNYPGWYILFKILKENFPEAKYIFDIKTPLLVFGKDRAAIQSSGVDVHEQLDVIVSLSRDSVETWIPGCKLVPVIYKLGIDTSVMRPALQARVGIPKRYVFIGSLSPHRKIDILIKGFQRYCVDNPCATLDIYGSGPSEKLLRSIIQNSNFQGRIRLRGLFQQDELLLNLSQYDVGIAWVPCEMYDQSPSLKILEYMAAEIHVLATSTLAHRSMIDQGFSFKLFSDNEMSLYNALSNFSYMENDSKILKDNAKKVALHDYNSIISESFSTLFAELVGIHRYKEKLLDSVANNKKKHSLKLIIFCDSLSGGKGGAERVAMELACEMSARGHRIYVCYKNQGLPSYQSSNGVTLLPYNELNACKDLIRSINPDVFFVFYFNEKLKEYYSIVHGTNIVFSMQECTNPDRLCKNNWYGGRNGEHNARWEREIIASGAARIRLTMPSYINSFSSFLQNQVRAFANPSFLKSNIADNKCDAQNRKYIIHINGFKIHKNLITLLEAFRDIMHLFPDWDLKVVGNMYKIDNKNTKLIMDYVNSHAMCDRTIFVGKVDDMYSHYASSQVHVISSLSEGCPTVVLEAMSVGIPSVGFVDCPGTNELIKHEINGLLASSEDRVGSLKQELLKLLSSPELRERLGKQAFEDSKAFDPVKVYDQWEQLFYEAAEYKQDPERLLREQITIDQERALHARRMRDNLMRSIRI